MAANSSGHEDGIRPQWPTRWKRRGVAARLVHKPFVAGSPPSKLG